MRLYIVDAFTNAAFAGNPAGVVLLDGPADPRWMQSVAAELKHAETAFVEVHDAGPKSLRWFTPKVEVDLCGHATLAAAHVLGGSQVFTTRSGELRTTADNGWVQMDFPADPPSAAVDALRLGGVTVKEILRGKWDLLIRTDDAAEVRALVPDFGTIATWDARCVVVTAPGDRPGIDFVSRVFGPAVGVPEDPVTGSAHCMLSPYWSAQLGRDELVGEQASPRGGVVRVSLRESRVTLAGQAVTTVRGELLV
ncbi:PhzF family phenazine biosynthesis protein [Amycolatopsis pithecellobii]|uniref:Oxidoreductase n=1 Tax=Amycolatopsis pithecellobii TaxID=664692 RepID=A0A6N7YUB9_9PSEU|nr:PhzF family phenazine biosynthesis protein [Amycolatopsis pithecellobii]MTD56657.1 oxidoreductase [Amycolatopsis pithecellobii]